MNDNQIVQAKKRKLNDIVYTRPEFAKKIIDYFDPKGFCLDPCKGLGAFYNNLPQPKDWCEIVLGRDFLNYNKKVDWIFANFPWSAKALRPLTKHAYELSDNVVQLIRLHNFFGTSARFEDFLYRKHNLKEIILVDWKEAFDPLIKTPEGFALIVVHTQKNYKGKCKMSTNWI